MTVFGKFQLKTFLCMCVFVLDTAGYSISNKPMWIFVLLCKKV